MLPMLLPWPIGKKDMKWKYIMSIIMSAYDERKYNDKCLKSKKGQAYENIQIIIVDEASTDNTVLLLR